MHRRLFLPATLVLFLIFFIAHPGFAQNSILKDVSEEYLNKLIDAAKANYPHVKNLQHHIDIAEDNIKKARTSWFDVFTFSYVYQPHSTNFVVNETTGQQSYSYFNGIQVGVFFNLGNFLQKPFAVRQAKEELIIANFEQDEYYLTLTTEVKKRYYSYLQKMADLRLQTQSEQDAEDAFKNIRHKFEKGEETYESFNRAQVTVSDHIQSKIAAETDFLVAKAELEEFLGDKLENIK